MDIRFSNDGPAFPAELVEDFINGEVVFLCGAGVGAPQLPLFGQLLAQVYDDVGTEATEAEVDAALNYRFEEAFGSIERRLANPKLMFKAVSNRLKPAAPDLTNHKTILRLARNLDNKVCLITTNFDTFFERALEILDGKGAGKLASHTPQSLPSPGGSDFSGVMHIHGRISDDVLGLEDTSLVLTSATYGDAYMRSGWASRFLFDLLRCKTLVLIGYSAGDAPVRYFLSVLEADRQRFKDIRNVYAFDGVDSNHAQADKRWAGIAVVPLAFQKNSRKNYGALWEDLAKLADFVESPKAMRRARAAELLQCPFDPADENTKATIKWLYADRNDLLDVAVQSVSDPKWFDFLFAERLVDVSNLAWVIAAWCAREWTDSARISAAITWHKRLGPRFGNELQRRLMSPPAFREPFRQAWESITKASLNEKKDHVQRAMLEQRLRSDKVRDADLQSAVYEITPVLTLRERRHLEPESTSERRDPRKVADLVSVEMRTGDGSEADRLRRALSRLTNYAERTTSLCTVALRSVLEEAREFELIGADWDGLNIGVPAVEEHRQNEFHDGVMHLAVLLSTLLPEVAAIDAEEARLYAEMWKKLPGQIGCRLWLTAMRNRLIYSPEAVANALLELSHDSLWENKREIVMLLEARILDVPKTNVAKVCRRILEEGPLLFPETASLGKRDWRPIARDREIWIRLQAIERSSALPKFASTELKKLKRKPHITKADYGERDLFNVYLSGVTYVSGDASAFVKLQPQDKIAQALEQQTAWDPNVQRNWSAYCSSDPLGAISSLDSSRAFSKNLSLWSDLIGAVSWAAQNETDADAARRRLVAAKIFRCLDRAPSKVQADLANRLADLWPNSPNLTWWDRIWQYLHSEKGEDNLQLEDGSRFYDRAINSASGRHARHLIERVDFARSNKDQTLKMELFKRLEVLLSANSNAGWVARGILARHASFVLSVDYKNVRRLFALWLSADNTQGRLLRATMIEAGSLSKRATRVLKLPLLMAIAESRAIGHASTLAAANLLRPLISQLVHGSKSWGITPKDVRESLRLASPSIRSGAAEFFRRVISGTDMPPEDTWERLVKPTFEQTWPQEKSLRHADYTIDLAAICVYARAKFPDALSVIKPYLYPLQEDWASLHFIDESAVPEDFPSETIELLWQMFGPGSASQSADLADILDRVKTAQNSLQFHRRFQWLEQRAVRY